MLSGLPETCEYFVNLAIRQPKRDSMTIVLYHLLGDLINAAQHALDHYLPLDLSEPFLQKSSLGSPYQKWAKFTVEDFEDVDRCLQRLAPVAFQCYTRLFDYDSPFQTSWKDAWCWFHQLQEGYRSCQIDRECPKLVYGELRISPFVDPEELSFLNVWTTPQRDKAPEIVDVIELDIAHRGVVHELRCTGLDHLDEMRTALLRFAQWIRANYSIEDAVAHHRSTLSEGCLG
jgi:hypothetical protein